MAELLNNPQIIAILTAVIPTLVWLWFWLRNDKINKEPKGLLFLTYIAGGLVVALVLPLESVVNRFGLSGAELIFVYAGIEELAKFLVVYLIDFNSVHIDEPIDYGVYLVTGALGFATVENVLFLLSPEVQTSIPFIIEIGTLRFLGATILHSVLAITLGSIIGFVFYKRNSIRRGFTLAGLLIVTILHTFFNYFIIEYIEIDGLLTLAILWVLTIFCIWLFEKVRRVNH